VQNVSICAVCVVHREAKQNSEDARPAAAQAVSDDIEVTGKVSDD